MANNNKEDVHLPQIQEEICQDDASIKDPNHETDSIIFNDATSATSTTYNPTHHLETSNVAQPNVKRKNINHKRNLLPVICTALLSAFLLAHEARPTDMKVDRRSSVRSLTLSFSSGLDSFQSWRAARVLENDNNNEGNDNNNNNKNEENDEEKGNDDKGENNNNDDDVVADGDDAVADDAAAADDAVADDYYYEEVVEDDFFAYVDDTIEEQHILPMGISDWAGFISMFLALVLSVQGGIGSGAVLVTIFIVIMDFPPKVAIPLSSITGLGSGSVGIMSNAPKRHPLSNRPLIDWDLVLIITPLTLLGAIGGTYLNRILEEKVLVVLLVFLLSLVALYTLKKARKMHHAEELYIKRIMWAKTKRKHHDRAALPPNGNFGNGLAEADPPFHPKVHTTPQRPPRRDRRDSSGQSRHSGSRGSHSAGTKSSHLTSFSSFIVLRREDAESVKSSLIEEEADPLPQNKITYIVAMFSGVISLNIFKGGAAFESPLGIQCGSIWFWGIEILLACWLILCTYLAGHYLLRRHAIKEAVGYDYVRGDIRWDVRTIILYPTVCLFAGTVSGMFGIGCALLIGPMLIGFGMNPLVASATCGTMNIFTSLAASTSYLVLGSLDAHKEYAIASIIIGFVSALVGTSIKSKTITTTEIDRKKLERHSYLAYSMGIVVLVSALSMTVEALFDVINHSFDDGQNDEFCSTYSGN